MSIWITYILYIELFITQMHIFSDRIITKETI